METIKNVFFSTGGICTCAKCKARKQQKRLSVRVVPIHFENKESVSALKNYAVGTSKYTYQITNSSGNGNNDIFT